MKKFLACFMALMLSGCFFSTKNSTFYLLESIKEETSPVSDKKISIGVADILVPDYLQKPQIVLQQKDSPELKVSEFNRWASDLEGMIQNTLIEDFQKMLPKASIGPLMFGQNAQYVVKIEIEKMSGYLGENAILKGTWQIVSSYDKVLKKSDFNLQTPAGQTYASYVLAQSRLLSALALDIASKL